MGVLTSSECTALVKQIVFFAEAFIWVALIAAIIVTVADVLVKLAPLFEKKSYPAPRGVAPDPIKLIDALKNLIDALSKAPAWIAIFLAGVALLWATSDLVPDICKVAL